MLCITQFSSALLNSPELHRFMDRASGDYSMPHTPYIYLTFRQLKNALRLARNLADARQLEVRTKLTGCSYI